TNSRRWLAASQFSGSTRSHRVSSLHWLVTISNTAVISAHGVGEGGLVRTQIGFCASVVFTSELFGHRDELG
ncbi:MAG: hypothetical protein ACRDU4_21455, partial [Mycobacterium sp.]